MSRIGAVKPEGIRAGDCDFEGICCSSAACWEEVGEDAAAQGFTGRGESGLGDGVVLRVESEGDGVAFGGCEGVWNEFDVALAHGDGVV